MLSCGTGRAGAGPGGYPGLGAGLGRGLGGEARAEYYLNITD